MREKEAKLSAKGAKFIIPDQYKEEGGLAACAVHPLTSILAPGPV